MLRYFQSQWLSQGFERSLQRIINLLNIHWQSIIHNLQTIIFCSLKHTSGQSKEEARVNIQGPQSGSAAPPASVPGGFLLCETEMRHPPTCFPEWSGLFGDATDGSTSQTLKAELKCDVLYTITHVLFEKNMYSYNILGLLCY